ncbi:hypothetical protein DMI65_24460 [Escherichia coli]|nr:hypothetical protein [Escherichia coli]
MVRYTSSDRTNDQVNHTAAGGDKADAWTAGLKYDANNIYPGNHVFRNA